jgi:hypothetical protein
MPQGQASHKHHQGIYVMPEYCVQWHTLTLTFVHLPVITLLISSAFVYPVKQAHCARVGIYVIYPQDIRRCLTLNIASEAAPVA